MQVHAINDQIWSDIIRCDPNIRSKSKRNTMMLAVECPRCIRVSSASFCLRSSPPIFKRRFPAAIRSSSSWYAHVWKHRTGVVHNAIELRSYTQKELYLNVHPHGQTWAELIFPCWPTYPKQILYVFQVICLCVYTLYEDQVTCCPRVPYQSISRTWYGWIYITPWTKGFTLSNPISSNEPRQSQDPSADSAYESAIWQHERLGTWKS